MTALATTGPLTASPLTVNAAIRAVTRRLDAAGIASARLDARLLVAHATGIDPDRLRLDPGQELGAAAIARLEALVDRRAEAREPVSRIVGTREFWSLPFALSPETLDPRPDSETLIEAVLARFPDRRVPVRVLDLGTGTGCLLLALLSELPNATGIGLDIAPGAVATARGNAAALGLDGRARFETGDWSAAVEGRFECVVSNPPYIPSATIGGLEPEVARHDPRLALDGGADGVDAYRAIAALLPDRIAPGGTVALEVGEGQATAVAALLADRGMTSATIARDLAGKPRCVIAEAQPKGRKNLKNTVARGVLTC